MSETMLPGSGDGAVYRASPDGAVVLYAGQLDVRVAGATHRAAGWVELRLPPIGGLGARFAGPFRDLAAIAMVEDATIAVPAGADLNPPREWAEPEREGDEDWVEQPIDFNRVDAGDLRAAVRFVFHISGAMELRRRQTRPHGFGKPVSFALPGWRLELSETTDNVFRHVVKADPLSGSATEEEVDELGQRLFSLLSVAASGETGVLPVCGLDSAGGVVWSRWAMPRVRARGPGVRWCPREYVTSALPQLARGYSELASDAMMERVSLRAAHHLLTANGDEVLDVRIPVGCSGLEVLAWAVLRKHGWLDPKSLKDLTTAAAVRLLLRWAEIPADVPPELVALESRRRELGLLGGPEVLFNVRNRLVHPPKRLDDPAWPESGELVEAWQLACWYLELVLLRVLNYDGEYWCRLRLGRPSTDVEPVPWRRG